MLDDTQGLHHQQQLEQQWIERDYDIAFGSFAKNFKEFVESHEKNISECVYCGKNYNEQPINGCCGEVHFNIIK